jgi:hypothetical protein
MTVERLPNFGNTPQIRIQPISHQPSNNKPIAIRPTISQTDGYPDAERRAADMFQLLSVIKPATLQTTDHRPTKDFSTEKPPLWTTFDSHNTGFQSYCTC